MMSLTTKIIYGTAWKKERTTALVVSAVLQGFRAIDTGEPSIAGTLRALLVSKYSSFTRACKAHHSGLVSEDLVGAALLELQNHNIKREDLFLQTKFTPIGGQDTSKPIPYNSSDPISQQITTSCQKSLANLHTTYLDSYLLHSPLPTIEQTLEAWHTLMKLQDEGKVRMIGLSNTYDVRILAALQKARKVQVVQNRWYEGNDWDKQVFNYCREHEIMYQSFWTLTGSPSLLGYPAIVRIAEASGLSAAQTVFRFAQLKGVIPLSGTTNEIHMQQDVAIENHSLKEEGLESSFAAVKEILGE